MYRGWLQKPPVCPWVASRAVCGAGCRGGFDHVPRDGGAGRSHEHPERHVCREHVRLPLLVKGWRLWRRFPGFPMLVMACAFRLSHVGYGVHFLGFLCWGCSWVGAMSTPSATSVVNTFAFPCWCRVLHAYTTFLPEKLPNFKLFQSPCVPEVPQHGQIVQQRSILTARIDSLSLESGGFEPKSCQLTSVVNTFAFPGCGALGVAGGCRETKQFGVNEPAGVEQMGHT